MDGTHHHHEAPSEMKVPFTEAEWEERYSSAEGGIWSGNPNPVLVAEVTGLPAGTALDVGCGEGADALWLASHGWTVTGTDISTVALKRAASQAKAQGLDVAWRHVDLLKDAPPAGAYDLVTAHYMHLPSAERRRLYAQLADAVKAGGTLLLVGHHPSDIETSAHRPNLPDMFFTAEDLAADLDPAEWEVLVTDARPRQTKDPEGREVTIRDTVLVARRAGAVGVNPR